ncbi:MAG: hypothetical protein QF654_02550 [Alphaproteobacteria bacterium]|jgi:hypothetical protein|nr:hypothetical protein [Alphaproteobacteria bacterium]
MTVRLFNWFALALVAAFAMTPFGGARAASQMLALLEIGGSTPLVCEGGVCKAEFSTFCLQKDRPLPGAWVPYEVAEGGNLHLVLSDPAGGEWRVPAADYIRIKTARASHTAVIVELAEGALAALGAEKAAVEVGPQVTLAPVEVAGDTDPLTEQDKLIAIGPLRITGANMVDRAGASIEAVRTINRLVNALPDAVQIDAHAKQRLWGKAVDTGFEDASAEEIGMAAQEYGSCWNNRLVELGGYSVRNCLQQRHDWLMWDHVKRYWKAVGAGS